MSKLKILIVEDEVIIAESLKLMLEGMGYEIPAMFSSGKELLDAFIPGFADIIIMDINLRGNMNGIEASIEIRAVSTIPIIYITDNKDEYLRKKAIYETNTAHYITKPFTRLDISVAVDLAIKAIKTHELMLQKANSSSYLLNDCIFVKDGQAFNKILINDIVYLKAEGSYCNLYFKPAPKAGEKNGSGKKNDGNIMFSENLSFLEEKLRFAKDLVRIHRSFIVNVKEVKKIQENRLWVGETEIPIGKTYKNEIRERFRFV